MLPLVLDFDGSVGALPGEVRIALGDLQEPIRLSCTARRLAELERRLPEASVAQRTITFTGSGDFHHVTLALLRKCASPVRIDVVVLDNHPDNMRYPWGVHCGSWVMHAARLPWVRRVDVLGITSADVTARHAWENHLLPLLRGKVGYWCIGVDTTWAARLGLSRSVRSFDSGTAMLQSFLAHATPDRIPLYLSIDKDVLSPAVARTNWDQGVLTEQELRDVVTALGPRSIAVDVTGDISSYRYESRWKRLQGLIDPQPAVDSLDIATWQAQHNVVNRLLVELVGRQFVHR